MTTASLIRRVSFRSHHHYGRADWSDVRNQETFGVQRISHAHRYVLEVVVAGKVDEGTGFVVDLDGLDGVLKELIVEPLDGHDLNVVVPEFSTGRWQPSTERLAQWCWNVLVDRIPGSATLSKVRVFESDELGAEYQG